MLLGGLEPCSFSDYPGRPAAVLFTQGCNFRCPFCHNPDLLPLRPQKTPLPPVEEVLAFLAHRRARLGGVVISGGEPTIQEDLGDFLLHLKRLGYAVKLDTNGSRPGVLADLLAAGLLDYIAMDLKAPPGKYERLCGAPVDMAAIREAASLIAASGVAHHFRTTVVPSLLAADDLDQIRRALLPSGSRYVLQPFRPAPRVSLRARS